MKISVAKQKEVVGHYLKNAQQVFDINRDSMGGNMELEDVYMSFATILRDLANQLDTQIETLQIIKEH